MKTILIAILYGSLVIAAEPPKAPTVEQQLAEAKAEITTLQKQVETFRRLALEYRTQAQQCSDGLADARAKLPVEAKP